MKNQKSDRSQMQVFRRLLGMCAVVGLLSMIGCSGGPSGDDTDKQLADTGVDATGDVGGETGIGPDTGDVSDGGDAEAGSSCSVDSDDPAVDRDRDGLPNECDNFPYLNHGGENVQEATVLPENELRWSNDSYLDAESESSLDLPAKVDGSIGPVESTGDLDHYAFTVERPTAVLIHLEADGSKYWPGGILTGREDRNRNKRVQLVGASAGQNATREVFLPAPGRYVFAVSDVRNLISDTSDVGGSSDFDYTLHLTTLPLPSPTDAQVPGSASHSYDRRLHVYSLDPAELDGLKVEATGAISGQRGVHQPVVALYDPEARRTLAYTLQQQINDNTRTVSLTSPVGPNLEKLYVISDHFSQSGDTSVKLTFRTASADSELETIQSPEDERADKLAWLQPGVGLDGMIGPPRASSQTDLAPDVDYYLYSASRGQTVKVTVTPKEGSQLKPDLLMGRYYVLSDEDSSFDDFPSQSVPVAESAGTPRSVEFYFTSRMSGEVAFRLRHAPNNGSDNPVGGQNYNYTIKLEVVEPDATEVPIPGSGQTSFAGGEVGFFSLTNPGDKIVRISPTPPDGPDLDLVGELARTDDDESIGLGTGTVEFHGAADQNYLYAIRDEDGKGTQGENVTLEVETRSLEDLGQLPVDIDRELSSGSAVGYHRFQASKGERIDVRMRAPAFKHRMAVYSLPDYRRVGQGAGNVIFRAEQDGAYVVRVWSNNDKGGAYQLGVRSISPTNIGELPADNSGTLDKSLSPDWYKLDISPDKFYQLTLATSGSEKFEGRISIFDPWDMSPIAVGGPGMQNIRPGYDGQIYVAISDSKQRSGSDYNYSVEIRGREIREISPGQPRSGTLPSGRERALFLFSTDQGGAIEIQATTPGVWTPQVELVDQQTLETFDVVESYEGEVYHVDGEAASYGVWVEATDPERSGPLEFSLEVQTHAMNSTTGEGEPNDSAQEAKTISQLPAIIEGTLGPGNGDFDQFAVPLQAGQRIWAMTLPPEPLQRYQIRPILRIVGPGGRKLAQSRLDGYGWYPSLAAKKVPSSGNWIVELQQWSNEGDYFMYIFASDAFSATESEPNDDRANAQDLGEIDANARIEATVDSNDPTDVYQFDLKRDLGTLRIFLENANPGHNLVLTDSSGNQVAASGPAHGGSSLPLIEASEVEAGTYYLTVGKGNGGGELDVIMWLEP